MAQIDPAGQLALIAEEVKGCKRCRLWEHANKAVPGAGNPRAEIMFIGEGPGFNEDKTGLPFVGRSGDYLEKMLALIGLKRDDVFIGNVVKHRPPDNRDPLPDEILACKPYLDQQVEIIQPLLIATLGRFSMARYFPKGKITQIHGQPKIENGLAYYPLFHPAAVLRNPAMEPQMEADFRRIPEILEQVKALRKANPPTSTPSIPTTPTQPDDPDKPPTQMSFF